MARNKLTFFKKFPIFIKIVLKFYPESKSSMNVKFYELYKKIIGGKFPEKNRNNWKIYKNDKLEFSLEFAQESTRDRLGFYEFFFGNF